MTQPHIAGMIHGHCASKVQRALALVEGVTHALDAGHSGVEGGAGISTLIAALEEGYQAFPVER